MILRSFLICFVLTVSTGQRLRTLEYREGFTTATSELAKVFKDEFTTYIETGIESDALKVMFTMLRPSENVTRVEVEQMSAKDQSFVCTTCRSAAGVLMEYLKKDDANYDIAAQKFIIELCHKLKIQTKEVCEGFAKLNWPIMKYILGDKTSKLTEDAVCSVILQGSNCVTKDPNFDWKIEIDGNGEKITQSKPAQSTSSSNDLTILQITDVHYDPNYKPGSLAECNKPMCCNADSGNIPLSEGKTAGKWTDYRNCDVPMKLYVKTLEHITNTHKKIDYIYYTGDIVDHGVWKTTEQGILKSLKEIYKEMKETFKDIKVYPIIGNHESQPLNQFAPDYMKTKKKELSTQWLYDYLAEEWSTWLPEDTKETIKKGGYYTAVPRKGFRIIALNNNDCYTFNFWILYDPEYLSEQLIWLHDTLLKAEQNGEHVHILAHVPSGAGSCFVTWAREYRKIIQRFHKIIGGIFNGHTHRDEFSVIYSTDNKYAINVAWNGGSLTPFSYVNPNYRTYNVEPKSYQVVTHDTWIFNLTEANRNPDKDPAWFKEYSFGEAYGLKDLSPASLHSLLQKFAKDHDLLRKYWEHKVKKGDPSLANGCDRNCLFEALCEAATSQFDDMKRCEELELEFLRTIVGGRTTSTTTRKTTTTTTTTKKPGAATSLFGNLQTILFALTATITVRSMLKSYVS